MYGTTVIDDEMTSLRDVWEATSFQLARLQSNPRCVENEQEGLKFRSAPQYHLSFSPADLMSTTVADLAEGKMSNTVLYLSVPRCKWHPTLK